MAQSYVYGFENKYVLAALASSKSFICQIEIEYGEFLRSVKSNFFTGLLIKRVLNLQWRGESIFADFTLRVKKGWFKFDSLI